MSDSPDTATQPPSFHLLAKPTGSTCNLDCADCFFLGKEALYPALARRCARSGQAVAHTIQTNGTKIDGDGARFFRENGFLVGIGIDGPRECGDAYRRDKRDRPTFDRVMRGLSHLREQGVEWHALTAVHAANADHPAEVYRFLRAECGARFIQFIPIVERPYEGGVPRGDPVTARSVAAAQWGRFLTGVFEEWVRRDVGEVYSLRTSTSPCARSARCCAPVARPPRSWRATARLTRRRLRLTRRRPHLTRRHAPQATQAIGGNRDSRGQDAQTRQGDHRGGRAAPHPG